MKGFGGIWNVLQWGLMAYGAYAIYKDFIKK